MASRIGEVFTIDDEPLLALGMDIYITPQKGNAITIPVLPENINIGGEGKFMKFQIISMGDVEVPRGQTPEEYTWSSFFPGDRRNPNDPIIREYTDPATLIKEMERIRDSSIKCKLVVTGTDINADVYIKSFKGKYSGGYGDFFYDIKLVEARSIKVFTTDELKIEKPKTTPTVAPRPAPPASNNRNYKVKTNTGVILRLRSSPNGKIVARIPNGTTVSSDGQEQSGWRHVCYNGTWGWSYGKYLK